MIVNYADDILFRGCYRGQKSCHGPLDSLMRVLKKTILKMDARFRYNRGLPRCGFKVKGGWNGEFYFGDENVRCVLFCRFITREPIYMRYLVLEPTMTLTLYLKLAWNW